MHKDEHFSVPSGTTDRAAAQSVQQPSTPPASSRCARVAQQHAAPLCSLCSYRLAPPSVPRGVAQGRPPHPAPARPRPRPLRCTHAPSKKIIHGSKNTDLCRHAGNGCIRHHRPRRQPPRLRSVGGACERARASASASLCVSEPVSNVVSRVSSVSFCVIL